MQKFFKEHHGFWTVHNRRSLYVGLLLLVLAFAIQASASRYSYKNAVKAPFVSDILLDNLPTVNLDVVIVQGALLVFIVGGILLVRYPHYLLFGMKAVALFVIVRAMFINLTHVGLIPRPIVFDDDIGSSLYSFFDFEGNYFFSGHTGLPFLMALILWPKHFWRNFFLGVSMIFGVSVLIAHVHYSIDVFAAPFMTYGIFKIAQWLFLRDYLVLNPHPRVNHPVSGIPMV